MRLAFRCIDCGIIYLPPEGLAYSDGSPASPLRCTVHQVAARELGVADDPAAVAVALFVARQQADRTPGPEEQPVRPDVRPSWPAKTRRAASNRGGRSKYR
ncbi:hypothetical protein GCM10009665_61620 [Kitasatospora nipponensis]|uniref:Uncharacterized protein n=1 Tax=Kitasatospora nipponensis TaxID=258049 RepID=A0ABP4HK18_9ACTN